MSQRRGGTAARGDAGAAKKEEMVPFSQVLDKQAAVPTMDREGEDVEQNTQNPPSATSASTSTAPASAPLSLDHRYEAEAQELKLKQWKEGPFATGLTDTSWDDGYNKYRKNPREACVDMDDSMPCLCCSALVCGYIGAGRVGNMAVLKQSTEWVEEVEEDENGESKTTRFTRPRLDVMVGPYWPMLVCVTYPLILGVSAFTLFKAIPGKHPMIILFWAVCTCGLIYALAMTAFRDPGILPRYLKPPPQNTGQWRWSDRAHSYKPRGAYYDPDTAVIVEGFDHTCPWTGTAIGAKNMFSFQFFVCLVFVCLMLDIVLLTGGIR